MKSIKNYIRYNSRARERFYKILKLCDKSSIYNSIYKRRINSKALRVSQFPRELSIETTNLCNAKCTICAHPEMKRSKGKMKSNLVNSLIEQTGENKVEKLFLSGFGEPLIDKRLPEFIAFASEKGIDNISIVTNGYLLTPQAAYELIESGLNEIVISMDGFTAETYEKIRVGLNFNRLVENIRGLSSVKNRKKANISISCVNLIHNQMEREIAFNQFGPYVDAIYFRQAQGWTGHFDGLQTCYSPHFEPNAIPCRYLWNSASVYIDGIVPACCLDYEAEGVMGNAVADSLRDIWRGEKFEYYRQAHLTNDKSKLTPCSKCSYYSVWW